jgi:chloride channel 3/4/5
MTHHRQKTGILGYSCTPDGVYDLAQHLLGHPFLDGEHALSKVQLAREQGSGTVQKLVPPAQNIDEITVQTGPHYRVSRETLRNKLSQLKARGLRDAGLVLVNDRGICHGYLPEAELGFALQAETDTETGAEPAAVIDLLEGVFAEFIDRTPLTVSAKAPIEYAVEMFGKLGLRYLIIIEEETARVLGVVIKKRLVSYLDSLHNL